LVSSRKMCFDPPAMTKPYRFRFAVTGAVAGLALAGCALFGDDAEIPYKALPAAKAHLVFSAPALSGAAVSFRIAEETAAGHRLEHGRWDGRSGARAELMLAENNTGTGISSPADPRDLTGDFPDLVRLEATFGDLYQSDTALGPSVWRRLVAGDRTCVIFRQHWDSGPETPVFRTLTGYYCEKLGGTFTVQDAAAILRTVSVKRQKNSTTSTDRKRS
jgi:hypothetical protein